MNDARRITSAVEGENHQRSLRDLVREFLGELREFSATRLQVMRSELQEAMASVKVAIPLALVALVFLLTGFLLLSAAAVAIVARAFAGSTYAWFFALVIVGVVWTATGAIATFFAYNEFRFKVRFPKTVGVLKADRAWLQSEARG